MLDLFQHERCLVCQEVMDSSFGWVDLFFPEKEESMCQMCKSKLQRMEGETCQICGRSFESLDPQYRNGNLCNDCTRWEDDSDYKGVLTQNHSIYQYNDFLKEIIAKYKYRGDYVLAKIFVEEIQNKIKNIKPDFIIPIPLSEERLQERGFNQAEALIIESGFKSANLLTRIHSEKQSKKSRSERIHLPRVFHTTEQVKGKILLVDDIYTTGSTLRHAAKVLEKAGAESIYSLTIARG
ncbi:ComF family protein [Bacillus sp. CGMCC 1.16607]|uniref:ComF family protein n=1 Tax=Bacillus sp. CGMCC 1.16607 TaxID=3351842 RepID=UPI00362B7509